MSKLFAKGRNCLQTAAGKVAAVFAFFTLKKKIVCQHDSWELLGKPLYHKYIIFLILSDYFKLP